MTYYFHLKSGITISTREKITFVTPLGKAIAKDPDNNLIPIVGTIRHLDGDIYFAEDIFFRAKDVVASWSHS